MPRFVTRYVVQFTEPDLAASSWVDSSYAVTGLNAGGSTISGSTNRGILVAFQY